MRESPRYQAILQEGRREALEAFKNVLLELGQWRFGEPPSRELRQRIDEANELNWLNLRLKRILDAKSWEDLLH